MWLGSCVAVAVARLAAAALIRPLAWELQYAVVVALKSAPPQRICESPSGGQV